jgi:class 3 adenylate cyclase
MASDTITTDNKVVLFADILGFAALTEAYPIDLDLIRVRDRLLSHSLDIDTILAASRNLLTHTFSGFHSSLRAVLNLASMRHSLTAITFSDSAFVATTHAYEAVNIAIDLLHALLPQKIPLRMGIAYGSFTALRFRSDVTSDGGDHTAQFLGTAVVRAHAAETCGIKGLRILLHSSVIPLLDDIHRNPVTTHRELSRPVRYIECSEKEKTNKAGVQHEIDYWYLTPTKEVEAWHGLQDMWNEAPQSQVEHYETTAEAINRMRITQGHEPLKKLHRRTLP